MDIQQKEILRYLGYGNKPAEGMVLEQIEEVKKELLAGLTPKSVYGKWDCQVSAAGAVKIGNTVIRSKNLARHIKGCEYAILLAATLGTKADMLIRRYSVLDMGMAAVAQAVCTAMIEAYCDDLECRIAREQAATGWHLKSRFSPGYGDFGIACQKDIFNLLECGKQIGITLTESLMMIPEKSITAVIGLTREEECHKGKCRSCANLQCEFRKD